MFGLAFRFTNMSNRWVMFQTTYKTREEAEKKRNSFCEDETTIWEVVELNGLDIR